MKDGQPSLFPGPESPPIREPAPKFSAQRARTLRQKAALARGVHPLMGTELHPTETCGSCGSAVQHRFSKTFWKCGERRRGAPCSPATDIRLSWPGCRLWKPKEADGGE